MMQEATDFDLRQMQELMGIESIMLITHSHIVLDACCILNFCASGKFLEILKSLPAQIVVTTVVQERELKTLQRLQDEENEGVIRV